MKSDDRSEVLSRTVGFGRVCIEQCSSINCRRMPNDLIFIFYYILLFLLAKDVTTEEASKTK